MSRARVLAIDQGTTGTTAMLLDPRGVVRARGYAELPQHFPRPGWVEHDGEEIWASVGAAVTRALRAERGARPRIVAIGITNQRETTLVWSRRTGRPVARAIVWQDRRTSERCAQLRRQGFEAEARRRTGLVPDPYFSATKLEWLLRADRARAARARRGELAFGTVDSWLLWKLTGGAVHATDPTNASRTANSASAARLELGSSGRGSGASESSNERSRPRRGARLASASRAMGRKVVNLPPTSVSTGPSSISRCSREARSTPESLRTSGRMPLESAIGEAPFEPGSTRSSSARR